MAAYLRQLFAFVILAGLLASVVVLRHLSAPPPETGEDTATALTNYGFYLREVAKDCGIEFVHQSATKLDEKLQHILPIVAGMSHVHDEGLIRKRIRSQGPPTRELVIRCHGDYPLPGRPW